MRKMGMAVLGVRMPEQAWDGPSAASHVTSSTNYPMLPNYNDVLDVSKVAPRYTCLDFRGGPHTVNESHDLVCCTPLRNMTQPHALVPYILGTWSSAGGRQGALEPGDWNTCASYPPKQPVCRGDILECSIQETR